MAKTASTRIADTSPDEAAAVPLPVEAPNKQPQASADLRARSKYCSKKHTFSCEWPRLSEGFKDLKKMLFGSNKPKRGSG